MISSRSFASVERTLWLDDGLKEKVVVVATNEESDEADQRKCH